MIRRTSAVADMTGDKLINGEKNHFMYDPEVRSLLVIQQDVSLGVVRQHSGARNR
jgi:hypothetical protein